MLTLGQLAQRVRAECAGDPTVEISGVKPFEMAQRGDLTLAADRRFLSRLPETRASAVIVPAGTKSTARPLLLSENPRLTFALSLSLFAEQPFKARGISPRASVGKGCQISDEVSIHPFVVIGNGVLIEEKVTLMSGVAIGDGCKIGAGSTLHPNVSLYSGVSLGNRVILHSGTVVGADGFGYVFDGEKQVKIHQQGTVEIGNDVEIGANSCIDRATFGLTRIESHVKIDNHVHVGHNCRIGENTIIVGCVGISGSVEIGKNCILAGQSGVSDHVRIGDGAIVMQKTAVTKNVPAGAKVSGPYSRDHRHEVKIQAILQRLPEIYRDWKKLKSLLDSE